MSDQITRLSDELARDPASLVFLALAEQLRQNRELEVARKVALRGLDRHPHLASAHELLARIYADLGELDRAFDEWDMARQLAPALPGPRKGMGFVRFRQGRLDEAQRLLEDAIAVDPGDESAARALAAVRHQRHRNGNGDANGSANGSGNGIDSGNGAGATTPELSLSVAEAARRLFAPILGDGERTALLVDGAGLVVAGAYLTEDGHDVAAEIGAELSGVPEEAQRAVGHLGLGSWRCVVFETEVAAVAMAPVNGKHLLMLAAQRSEPLGYLRRMLERCADRADRWLAEGR
ncbi:MAG: tetratricopeptide repeat protein [Gemmatimonadota bacterium]|nr:tetratricopeptide repeat protein [Gemmatimonadota bacterium]